MTRLIINTRIINAGPLCRSIIFGMTDTPLERLKQVEAQLRQFNRYWQRYCPELPRAEAWDEFYDIPF